MEIQKELKRDALQKILAQGQRADGRAKDEYRPIEIVRNPLQNAEGSAICRLGKTQVLCGIKFDMAMPFGDRPNEGILSTGCEFTPLGSHLFEPGPPSQKSIELARVVDRAVRSSECINLKSFKIEGVDKVLALYIDLWICDHDGNLFDAALLSAMAALQGTRFPKVEEGKIVRGEFTGPLPLSTSVVSSTFGRTGHQDLLDPSLDETKGTDRFLTIATTPENVCAVQKSGWAGYTQRDIMALVDISFSKGAQLRRCLSQ